MIAHSPAPWKFDGTWVVAADNSDVVLIACGCLHPVADGALVAAAPVLLGHLRALLETPFDPAITPLYQASARALIARLDGAA